jgi:hypothetical protein
MKLLGIINVEFNLTNQMLTIFLSIIRYWRNNDYNGTVHELFTDFKKAYDLVRRKY